MIRVSLLEYSPCMKKQPLPEREQIHAEVKTAYSYRENMLSNVFFALREKAFNATVPRRARSILSSNNYESPNGRPVELLNVGCRDDRKTDGIVKAVVTHNGDVNVLGIDVVLPAQTRQPSSNRITVEHREIPLEDMLENGYQGNFDVVSAVAVTHHLRDVREAMSIISDLLREDGIALLCNYNYLDDNPVLKRISDAWLKIYKRLHGLTFVNPCTKAEVISSLQEADLSVMGSFRTPHFLDVILARKQNRM